MNTKQWKALTVGFLLIAIAAVALAFYASSQRSNIQGPSALLALPDQSVWLGVDQELWHLSADGDLLARVAVPLEQGKRSVAFLSQHPTGAMATMVRGDSVIYLLNPATAQIQNRIQLQWPQDLVQHAKDSVYLAFHPDGRLAVATGGGHTVALFDGDGNFLKRTPPGTYQFTNGLWWQGDTLWTTDTNRFALVNLDTSSLGEERRVLLKAQHWPHMFLGDATTVPTPAAGGPSDAPMATLLRLSNGMAQGVVVDVWPDGRQVDYPTPAHLEPRGMQWRNTGLLLVDGTSFSVLRFDAQRQARSAFGSSAVQSELTQKLAARNALHSRYVYGLWIGGLFLVLGLLASRQERSAALQDAGLDGPRDLSRLGTPVLSYATRIQAALQHLGFVLPWTLGGWIVAILVVVPILTGLTTIRPVQIVLIVLLLFCLAAVGAMLLWVRALRLHDGSEGVANWTSVRFLQDNEAFWHGLEADERPHETLIVRESGSLTMTWVVLTNQRLLIYSASLLDQSLRAQYARSDIAKIRLLEPQKNTWWQRLSNTLWPSYRVDVRLRNGRIWSAWVATSVAPARRLVQSIQTPATVPASGKHATLQTPSPQPAHPSIERLSPKGSAMQQTLASLLLPGLGQWLQRRNRSAAYLFILWCVAMLFVVLPIAWALDGPKTFVAPAIIVAAVCSLAFMHLMSAWDAWRMRSTLTTNPQ